MDYFAGLDISMDETHICVVTRDGTVVYEGKSASTAEAIADKLSEAPGCHRIVFETGRMAPILFHGLSQLGLALEKWRALLKERGAFHGQAAATVREGI